jgi:hypothetical protein
VAKLATPKLEIWLSEDDDEPIVVQAINADMVLGETTARKHNWGTFGEAPMKNQTFLAWAACRRRHLIPDGMTFEQFEATAVSITVAEDPKPVLPTPPDPGSG